MMGGVEVSRGVGVDGGGVGHERRWMQITQRRESVPSPFPLPNATPSPTHQPMTMPLTTLAAALLSRRV